MSPPNQILILAPPSRPLVLRITNNANRPKLTNRQILHRPRLSLSQHNLPLHFFASVIRLFGALAYIHQYRRNISRFTVFRQNNRHRLITRDLLNDHLAAVRIENYFTIFHFFFITTPRSSRDHGQLANLRVPPRPRPLRSVENLTVRRKLQNRHITQPISPCPLRHQFRSRMKSRRPPLPVQPRQPLQIPLSRLPAKLIGQRRDILLPQQRCPLLRSHSSSSS